MARSNFLRASSWSIAILSLLGIMLLRDASYGVTRNVATTASDLVREALHREIYGLSTERQQLLSDAVRQDANYGPAQWQRGFIQAGGQWVDIDTLVRDGQSGLIKEYEGNREKCADTVEDQMRLANWCRDQQLPLQERAHLTRVVDLNSDHQGARERLGFRRIAGRWIPEAEIAENMNRRQLELDAAKRWRQELAEIGRDVQHQLQARRRAACERLGAINDVHAIPSMESVLSVSSQEAALAVVEAVGEFKGTEAVESLVRHAVFSEWPLVRQTAAERLKGRKWVSFVPLLLREMYTPLVSRFGITQLLDGRIVYTHSFLREGQEEQQILRLDTAFNRIRRPGGDGEDSLMRAFEASIAGVAERELEAARQNDLQATYNQRLVEALRIATYQDLPTDPTAWWQWWDKHNDVVRPNGKQSSSQYQVQQVAVVDRVYVDPNAPPPSFSSSTRRTCECFAAGTLVLTRRGEQAIESIRVGDLVLAQNVDTGELAFKPVLATTVRPPEELVKVRVGQDTFECSRGHLFWVAGYGWAKAGRLESGAALHCLRGAEPLSCVETGLKGETYNLVVADFHTYFVGKQRFLSHDVTQSRPTNAVVPGLKED